MEDKSKSDCELISKLIFPFAVLLAASHLQFAQMECHSLQVTETMPLTVDSERYRPNCHGQEDKFYFEIRKILY